MLQTAMTADRKESMARSRTSDKCGQNVQKRRESCSSVGKETRKMQIADTKSTGDRKLSKAATSSNSWRWRSEMLTIIVASRKHIATSAKVIKGRQCHPAGHIVLVAVRAWVRV